MKYAQEMFPHIPFPLTPYWAIFPMLFSKIFIDVIFKLSQ